VTTSWVKCPPWVNQPANSAFHRSGVGKCLSKYMDYGGWRPLNGRPGCVWLFGCRSKSVGTGRGAGLAYGLLAVRPLCLCRKSAAAAAVAACGAI